MPCMVCGGTLDTAIQMHGGTGMICHRCAGSVAGGLLYCSECGTGILPSNAVYQDGWLCPTCAWQDDDAVECDECCDEILCGVSDSTDYIVVNYAVREGNHYHAYHAQCSQSLVNCGAIRACSHCGMWTHELGGFRCARCQQPLTPRGAAIHDYSYMPQLTFLKGDNSCEELFLGVELEITPEDQGVLKQHSEALSLLPDFVYAKRDSSIPVGFEMVTHPFAQSWAHDHLHDWLSIFPQLYSLGYRSGDTSLCGTHIHMSKVAFTHAQLYKFMYFVYRHPSLMLLLSQRDSQCLSQYASVIDTGNTYRRRARVKEQGNRGRHDAVNISHKNTVELRIFNGTLNPLAFMKNIDTALCIYNYANDTALHALNLNSFLDYVRGNKHIYPYLHLFVDADVGDRTNLFGSDAGPVGQPVNDRIQQLYYECMGVELCV